MHANAKFHAKFMPIAMAFHKVHHFKKWRPHPDAASLNIAQHRSWRRRLLGLRASARCGRADKACRRRNAVRTATSKE
jgi:hypothetical protein